MMNALISAFVVTCLFATVYGQAVNNTGKLKCRRCNNALTLDDCINQVFCDSSEECYMDELITEQLTVVYNGGCRPKEVCASGNSGHAFGRKKRQVLVACSRCCDVDDDCNKRLCGIKSLAVNSSQCYSCERNSEQSQVTKPDDCVTLTTCQSDEVCYAGLNNIAGREEFLYGCKSKAWCRLLMDREFAALKECEEDPTVCGNVRRSGTAVCHSCCGDGGCNYGSCIAMNERLYNLYKSKVFDPITLTQTSKPSATASPVTPAPTSSTAAPTSPTAAPTSPTAAPTSPTAAPTSPTAAPTSSTTAPTSPTAAPTSPTAAPTSPTAAPTSPTAAPTSPTAAPTSPTAAPTSPTAAPTSSTVAPTSPTVAPTSPTAAPTSPTAAPTSPTAAPTSPTAAPPVVG